VAGGVLLLASLVLPWYHAAGNGRIDGRSGDLTAWVVHDGIRWLLLAAAIAPFVLAWVVLRDHELSWARGELTAVVAIAAFGIVGYLGVIDRPGDPPGLIGLRAGWFLALLGTILIFAGSATRASDTERKRKPPGVL
jgi:hypothetical protein